MQDYWSLLSRETSGLCTVSICSLCCLLKYQRDLICDFAFNCDILRGEVVSLSFNKCYCHCLHGVCQEDRYVLWRKQVDMKAELLCQKCRWQTCSSFAVDCRITAERSVSLLTLPCPEIKCISESLSCVCMFNQSRLTLSKALSC